MPLASGTRLGPYEIQSAIGAGGMGEVYKAHDTRLDRTVAIKVLPTELSGDPERRARFEREARTIAALSHPHICTLHDIGDAVLPNPESRTANPSPVHYLVMEHLSGETLADRLLRGHLPLDQALRVATEIADALAAAHRQGVIHRDLKPANVMLTKAGAKLLDFGVAKLCGPEASPDLAATAFPTVAPLTRQGLVIGTVPYMAPEQLEGKETDARSDIFSFGAVLYEMLTGRRPFDGESQASIITAIMSSQPPAVSALQAVTPHALDRVVQRCLAKDPDARWQSAADLGAELRWVAEGGAQVTAASRPAKRGRRIAAGAAALALAAGLGGAAMWRLLAGPAPTPLHFNVSIAEFGLTLTSSGLAVSPDGLTVVFAARGPEDQPRLYVRRLDSEQRPRPLEGTEDAVAPQFSPDGSWVAFAARGLLKKVPLREGPPHTLARISPQGVSRGVWTADGFIIVSHWPGVPIRVPAEGGTPTPLVPLPPGSYAWPHLLPDGKRLMLTVTRTDKPQVVVVLPDGRRSPVLQTAAMCARYLPTGHLVYEAEGRLRAAAFDPERLQLLGASRVVVDDIAIGEAEGSAATHDFDVSPTGTMVYQPASTLKSRLVWRDRAGRIERLPLDPRSYWCPSLSRDGRQVTVGVYQGSGASVWTGSVQGEPLTPLTFDGFSPNSLFSPDGRWVYFNSQVEEGAIDLFRRPSDSSLQAERLSSTPGAKKPTSVSRDGTLLFNLASGPDDRRIMRMNVERPGPAVPFGDPSGAEIEATFSPDGKWVAYQSNESGSWQIYVTPFPGPGPRRRVSIDGGMGPVWNPLGNGELFYQTRTALMAVRVVGGATDGAPKLLFACRKSEDYRREFDVAPDGERFLFMEPATPRTEINVITNWFEELKAKVPPVR